MISRPCFQRVVAVDQRQMRFAAAEQAGEQAAEMPVHRLERGAQAFAAFAVEVADRAAQAVDRFGQFGLLGQALGLARLRPGPVPRRRPEVDRADPLALGQQALVRVAFGGASPTSALAKAKRSARSGAGTESVRPKCRPFPGGAGLRGAARAGRGAGFARGGERFVGWASAASAALPAASAAASAASAWARSVARRARSLRPVRFRRSARPAWRR
jgi:hypothetical protein